MTVLVIVGALLSYSILLTSFKISQRSKEKANKTPHGSLITASAAFTLVIGGCLVVYSAFEGELINEKVLALSTIVSSFFFAFFISLVSNIDEDIYKANLQELIKNETEALNSAIGNVVSQEQFSIEIEKLNNTLEAQTELIKELSEKIASTKTPQRVPYNNSVKDLLTFMKSLFFNDK